MTLCDIHKFSLNECRNVQKKYSTQSKIAEIMGVSGECLYLIQLPMLVALICQ